MKGTMPVKRSLFEDSWAAAADLSSKQYYFVKGDSNGRVAAITATTDKTVGVLDNDPSALDREARVIHAGIVKVVTDGSGTNIARGDYLGPSAVGKAIKVTSNHAVAYALQPSTADGTVISALLLIHPLVNLEQITSIANHLILNSLNDGTKTVRLNSQDFTASSGDIIGFQSKPGAGTTGTTTVYGAQISPRVQDAIAAANLIGLNIDCILKGTTGNISGDVRGLEVTLTDENAASTRTIAGDMEAIRIFQQLTGHTVTGDLACIRLDSSGGTLEWTHFLKLPTISNVIEGAGGACNSATGFITIDIAGTDYYIDVHDGHA